MAKDKKAYILDVADMSRKVKPAIQEEFEYKKPQRRQIMTNDDDEAFIKKYYAGRTDAFRKYLAEDKIAKGWKGEK